MKVSNVHFEAMCYVCFKKVDVISNHSGFLKKGSRLKSLPPSCRYVTDFSVFALGISQSLSTSKLDNQNKQ